MLAASLTACSDSATTSSVEESSTVSVSSTEESSTESEESSVPETDAPETEAPETDAPETDPPETDAPETSAPEKEPETDTKTALEFAQQLMPGWNLGNQLEAVSGSTPSETAWGNPTITEDIILAVKDAGFKSVRIPVSYLSKIGEGPTYTVDAAWLDRIAEVVDMCVDNGMYAIINMHGDGYHSISGGWLLCDADNQTEITDKYGKVWAQIADKFKDYDEHLIFESMNEEFDGSYGAINNEYYENINTYNQTFVDNVRAAGGYNAKRYLLCPGWNTDINATTENETFRVPEDSEGRVMVSVHYYDPYEFCLKESAKGIVRWGEALAGQNKKTTWGDETYLDEQFDKLYDKFISKGIPVIIGEYGTIDKSSFDERNTIYRAYYAEYVNYAASQRQIVTVMWDNGYNGVYGHAVFSRNTCEQTQPEIIAGIMRGVNADSAPKAPTD
ncbi:MAG: glycoside hydrolase family 5 protein [Eubacterium sp.]|nr:glycoside hydrolase family 5 protein [Eubacterium sp.]